MPPHATGTMLAGQPPASSPLERDRVLATLQYFGLQFYLEDLLGRPVDLVTERALRPELRPYVEREAIHV